MDLRIATMDDARFVYDIRNETDVRLNSWDSYFIIWEDHLEWFKKHFKEFFIIYDDVDIGYVRKNNDYISIALNDMFRNRGVASNILMRFDGFASIKFENINSFNAFMNAGFRPVGWIMKK